MSKANDIAQGIITRLSAITRADGYATDAGGSVYRGRKAVPAVPALVLIEPEDLIESQALDGSSDPAGRVINAQIMLPFDIQGIASCEPDEHMSVGHALVADIKRAIFSSDLRFGGLATHTRYVGRVIDPRADGDTTVNVMVQIRVGIVENLANP